MLMFGNLTSMYSLHCSYIQKPGIMADLPNAMTLVSSLTLPQCLC